MPRPRKKKRSDLPANLYEPRPGYFVWRHPRTGKTLVLGRIPRNAARDQAIEANRYVEEVETERLVARLHAAESEETFGDWLETYRGILERKKRSPNTWKQYNSNIRILKEAFGHCTMGELQETRVWADWLDSHYVVTEKYRQAITLRSFLKACWNAAIAKGRATDNPIHPIDLPEATVKRARLTWDTLSLILEEARASRDSWIEKSILLALITAQRREDLAVMQFRERKGATSWVNDDGLYVIQIKTGNRVILPLHLDLPELGMSLEDVVSACRSNVASPWLIHQTRRYGNSPPGANIWLDTLSRRFADMRDAAAKNAGRPLWDEDKNPPTFHEIRSLAIRLYAKHLGNEAAQAIAGHKDSRMTAEYKDPRGAEWVRVLA